MLRSIILVGIGGGVGSIFRCLTHVLVNKYFQSIFPLSTFIVNMSGSLLIGVLLGLFERYQLSNSDLRHFFIVGFCGGFTTFSAFASENFNLFQSGSSWTAFLYIAGSIVLSLLFVWIGISVTK